MREVARLVWSVRTLYQPRPLSRRENQKRMVELQQRVLEYGADANAWIVSVIDRGPEHEERVYPRSSVKPEFLSSMNSVNLVVLNGLKSSAEHTFDHPGRDAIGVEVGAGGKG